MKNQFTTALLAIGTFLIFQASTVSAQTLKFGHINSAELLSLLPESKTADAELKKFGETLENQLKTMHAEYQNKVQDYQSKESLMAESIKQTKQKEILDLETRIQEFQEQGQSDIQKKKEEIYSPILKKAQDAINSIAKENGYTYIFDSSLGSLLFAQESNDVMPMVKKRLGITADAVKKDDAKTGDKKADTSKPAGDKKPDSNKPAEKKTESPKK